MADPTAQWTVMLYVAADTPDPKLTEGAWKSLEKLRSTGSTARVQVVAQAAFPKQPSRRFYFPAQPDAAAKDVLHCVVGPEPGDIDSGNKQTLCDFVRWGEQRCPARNYMVVLWGHGFGTDDYDPFPKLVANAAPDPKLYALGNNPVSDGKPALTADDFARHSEHHTELLFSSMPDFRFRTLLTNRDVGDALRSVAADGGEEVALLGFDACEMAMAEVWMGMLGGAKVAVGSEYEVPYNSWPYDLILERLNEKPPATPQEAGTIIVDAYNHYYSQPGQERTVTLSACDLAESDGLVAAMKTFVRLLLAEAREAASRHAIFHARNRTLQFDPHGFVDLRNFCQLAAAYLPRKPIQAASKEVVEALDRFVVASRFAPSPESKLARAKGLSVFFPKWIENPDYRSSTQRQSLQYLRGDYSTLVFNMRTGWDKLLLALIEPEESFPVPLSKKEKRMGILDQKGRKTGKKKGSKKKKKGGKKKH